MLERIAVEKIVIQALEEDIGAGDITSLAVVPEKKEASARIIAKQSGVLCGLIPARLAFEITDKNVKFDALETEGVEFEADDILVKIKGPARSILAAERVALNFLQQLSGIATLTSKFVEKAKKYPAKILDTRKTAPGLRLLEKHAVKVGGGENHRMGLYDAMLIKDNHIAIAGGIPQALKAVKKAYPKLPIEIEVTNFEEAQAALDGGAKILLLDNMTIKQLKEGVGLVKKWNRKSIDESKHVRCEASGGVNLKNVEEIAATGVDLISIGALTHSAPSIDMSLEFIL